MKLDRIRIHSIRVKLVMLIFVALIPLTVLEALEIKDNFESSTDLELKFSEDFAAALNSSFMNYLENIWTTEGVIGLSIYSNPGWDKSRILLYLNKVIEAKVGIAELSWVSADGRVLASTNPKIGNLDLSEREYIKRIVSGEDKIVSDLLYNHNTARMFVPVARGIRVNNQLKGIVVSTIDGKTLNNVFAFSRSGPTSSYGLIDKSGRIVFRNGSANLPYEKRKIKKDSPAWEALKGDIARVRSYKSSVDGQSRMGINYPIKPIGWACFVTTSIEERLAVHMVNMKKEMVALFILYIFSFTLAIIIGNYLINSISKLKDVAQEIINGNLSVKTNLTGNDEIAVVGKAFDKMAEKINQRIVEIEEYNNLKSQFLATMSHELKTPLNIILGCVQLIEKLDRGATETFINSVNKYNKMLKQNSYRLLRLINNLIDINKIEANSIPISIINGNIVKVVEDITMSIVEYTKLKKIDLTFDTEIEEKIMAFDPDKIERIILNLLSNAIKFTDVGGNIEVNIYDKGESVLVSVKDDGVGIPKEKQEIIFERFTQIDNLLRRKSEGSGIGLSLVKSLVEMHDGKISVSSEPGKGSEFMVEMPVKMADSPKSIEVPYSMPNVERTHIEFSDIYL